MSVIRLGAVYHTTDLGCCALAQGFLDILSKVNQSLRAKMRMKTHGVDVQEPKNKKDAWSIKESVAAVWQKFEEEASRMDYPSFMQRLSDEKAAGLRKAQKLVEKYAPEMAEFLKENEKWDDPISKADFRDDLGSKFTDALVTSNERVMVGKQPSHPSQFPVDAVEMRKADKKAAEWRENLKKHGIVMCDGASARPPSLVPLCPSVNATTRCGVPA